MRSSRHGSHWLDWPGIGKIGRTLLLPYTPLGVKVHDDYVPRSSLDLVMWIDCFLHCRSSSGSRFYKSRSKSRFSRSS